MASRPPPGVTRKREPVTTGAAASYSAPAPVSPIRPRDNGSNNPFDKFFPEEASTTQPSSSSSSTVSKLVKSASGRLVLPKLAKSDSNRGMSGGSSSTATSTTITTAQGPRRVTSSDGSAGDVAHPATPLRPAFPRQTSINMSSIPSRQASPFLYQANERQSSIKHFGSSETRSAADPVEAATPTPPLPPAPSLRTVLPTAGVRPGKSPTHASGTRSPPSTTPRRLPPPPPPTGGSKGSSRNLNIGKETPVVPTHRLLWAFSTDVFGQLETAKGEEVLVEHTTPDGAWCMAKSVVTHKRGLVPLNYLEPLSLKEAVSSVWPAAHAAEDEPEFVSAPMGFDYGSESGYARDIVGILSAPDAKHPNMLRTTTLRVRFTGNSASKRYAGSRVQLYINGRPFDLPLFLDGTGRCVFSPVSTHTFVDEASWLYAASPMRTGPHHLRFEHVTLYDGGRVSFCECTLWVMRHSDNLVISDIDGTITRSDVGGMINTAFRQKLGWSHKGYAHEGVCTFYRALQVKYKCRFLYLTSRPLELFGVTKEYVETLTQDDGVTLPRGPIVTDETDYQGSLRREVIDKTSHIFKRDFLTELRECFHSAGRDRASTPFLCGFGNKETDMIAYVAAGIPPGVILLVDTKSQIFAAESDTFGGMDSYSDSALMAMIQRKIGASAGATI